MGLDQEEEAEMRDLLSSDSKDRRERKPNKEEKKSTVKILPARDVEDKINDKEKGINAGEGAQKQRRCQGDVKGVNAQV